MATGKKGGGSEKPPQEDRILARLVNDSTQVTTGLTSYIGLLGRSPKAGYWLLYLTLDMSTSVEIREEDIVHSEQLPPDKSPFGSLGGTQVFVKRDARVTTTKTISRTHSAGAGEDEFDLDIRLGGGEAFRARPEGTGGGTCAAECPGGGTGDAQTCLTCASCGDTCFRTCRDTCRTQCDTCPGGTCFRTCGGTCRTECDTCRTQCETCDTCQTCQTGCGQATCNTCRTNCGQITCPISQCDAACVATQGACTQVGCVNTGAPC
jgi:hypothetical protein